MYPREMTDDALHARHQELGAEVERTAAAAALSTRSAPQDAVRHVVLTACGVLLAALAVVPGSLALTLLVGGAEVSDGLVVGLLALAAVPAAVVLGWSARTAGRSPTAVEHDLVLEEVQRRAAAGGSATST